MPNSGPGVCVDVRTGQKLKEPLSKVVGIAISDIHITLVFDLRKPSSLINAGLVPSYPTIHPGANQPLHSKPPEAVS